MKRIKSLFASLVTTREGWQTGYDFHGNIILIIYNKL